MDRVLVLLILVLGMAIWLNWLWLALISIAVIFLIFVGESEQKTKKAKSTKPNGEILTPVIVTDVGEPPMLYPDNFKLKVYTKGWGSGGWMEAAQGAASLVNLGYALITGKSLPKYSWDSRWDVDKIRKKKKSKKKDD